LTELRNEQGQTLEEFLSDYDPCQYERPSVTVDMVLITYEGDALLIQRRNHPSIGHWAVPGGFADMNETLDTAAKRELWEETGLEHIALTPLGMYGEPTRDPRLRIFTCAFLARSHRAELHYHAGDDAADAKLFAIHIGQPVRKPVPPRAERKHLITLPATATGAPLSADCSEYEIRLTCDGIELGVRCGIDDNGTSILLGGIEGLGSLAGDHGLILFDALRTCGMI